MKKYLILFIIFIIAISVITINAKTIYAIKDSEGNLVGATDQGYLSYEQNEQGYTIEILFSSTESESKSNEKSPEVIQFEKELNAKISENEQNNKLKADIIFVDSTNFVNGNYYYLQGVLKNQGKTAAYWVKLKFQALDKNGNLIQLKETYADPDTIAPGQEATYDTMIGYDARIAKFAKEIHWDNQP